MVEYTPVDLSKWPVLGCVDRQLYPSIELVHVFGNFAESAYYVTSEDEVFALGQNVCGRLGIGNSLTAEYPCRLDALSGQSVICFSTASIHSLALTQSGDVFAWGSNAFGQLGNGSKDGQDTPSPVIFPEGVKICQICTADRCCLALDTTYKLYHWGDIYWNCGSNQMLPTLLKWEYNFRVSSIFCGAFHAAALTVNGKVFTWGSNESGQLGHVDMDKIVEEPMIVRGQVEDQFIVKIACCNLVTVVLTQCGDLYAWGHNKYSVLSVGCPLEFVTFPQRMIFRKNFIDIASNNMQSIICAETENPHHIYIWKFDDEEQKTPTELSEVSILEGFAGSSMPIVERKFLPKPQNNQHLSLKPIQGPVRDIGKALFNKKELSDLTIELSDGEVYVHSLIMKTFSEHFKTLLADNWSSGKTVIKMTQYNSNAYRTFLKYVYTGILEPLDGPETIALCDIAVSYFENELEDLCVQMFRQCLNTQNLVHLYTHAVGVHSDLVDSCFHFTSQNLDAVILSEGFETLDPALSKSLILNAVKIRNNVL